MREGSSETDLSRSIARALDTTVQISSLSLHASYWFHPRLAAELTGSLEDRDLLNATFPPEGRGGERRHDSLSGIGDSRLGLRALATRGDGRWATMTTVSAGASLPTGDVREDPLVGPTDATLQQGAGIVMPYAGASVLLDLGAPTRRLLAEGQTLWPLHDNEHAYRPARQLSWTVVYGHWLADGKLALWGGTYGSIRGHDRRRELDIVNSGGRTVGAVGRVVVRLPASLDLAVEGRLPIYRYVHGIQVVEQVGGSLSLSWQR